MLSMLLSLAALAIINPAVPRDALGPPWPHAADETPVADSPEFRHCHAAVQLLVGRMRSRLEDPRFAHSPKWGWIMRARIVSPYRPVDITQRFTCWSLTGEHVKVFVSPERMFDDRPPPN